MSCIHEVVQIFKAEKRQLSRQLLKRLLYATGRVNGRKFNGARSGEALFGNCQFKKVSFPDDSTSHVEITVRIHYRWGSPWNLSFDRNNQTFRRCSRNVYRVSVHPFQKLLRGFRPVKSGD
jgi:hypothetical protein